MRIISRHYLFEFDRCDPRRIRSISWLTQALRRLCRRAPLHPVKSVRHEFSPHGLTAFMILKESHLALSTWPEHRYAALNLLLCGACPGLRAAINEFGAGLGARRPRRRSWACSTRGARA